MLKNHQYTLHCHNNRIKTPKIIWIIGSSIYCNIVTYELLIVLLIGIVYFLLVLKLLY